MAFGPPLAPIPKKKRGPACAGCGCGLLALVIIFLLIAAIGYGSYHEALSLTDATSAPVPQTDNGPATYATAQHKIDNFQQAIEHTQPATLHLTADEINTYIARDPSMAIVRGHVFVKLQGDEATVQGSIPLGAFEKVVMADRYVDCTATFSLAFDPQDKNLTVDLRALNIKGQPALTSSNPALNQSINNALAKQIQANGPVRDFLSRTQKIAIENGELVIETR